MSTYSRIAVVTGSNKGIGLACVRQLALQYPQSPLNTGGPLLVYLTARNKQRGETALQAIRNDEQIRRAGALLSDSSGGDNGGNKKGWANIKYLPLDVTSRQSIDDFVTQIKHQHPDGIDILINNAGIALDGFDADMARDTVKCNYYGALHVTRGLLPLIRPGGRIVNVSSAAGFLRVIVDSQGNYVSGFSDRIRHRYINARSTDDLDQLMEEFIQDVRNQTWQQNWPSSAYMVAKAGMIGMVRVLSSQQPSHKDEKDSQILFNACCPGWVVTDMTKGKGHKDVDQGARTPVMLALADIAGQTGLFWKDETVQEWEQVQTR